MVLCKEARRLQGLAVLLQETGRLGLGKHQFPGGIDCSIVLNAAQHVVEHTATDLTDPSRVALR